MATEKRKFELYMKLKISTKNIFKKIIKSSFLRKMVIMGRCARTYCAIWSSEKALSQGETTFSLIILINGR